MRAPLLAATLVLLAVPATAPAGLVAVHEHPVSLVPGARAPAAARSERFDMFGVRWLGGGSVVFRTRSLAGRWRPWRRADGDDRTGRWHDGSLEWTGPSTAYQVRGAGTVSRLRAYDVQSRVLAAPVRATSAAGAPAIVSRAAWHANEEIVRATPIVASRLRLAIVHHTAGTNDYTRAQAAAIVRGIEAYHVLGNGWNDIGYNFLVDRFGTIYEGRGGGDEQNVVGAHALGFNVGTAGVALIGDYSTVAPTTAQQAALVRLLAWRLDVAHLDPQSWTAYTTSGNPEYRSGRVVTLRAISGHRDTGFTECPGQRAYQLIPAWARRVAATGLPKLYVPEVVGVVGAKLRFRARLSSALPWTVTIVDSAGATVAAGSGRGSIVAWTWDGRGVARGSFTWTIAAPGVRAASGVLVSSGPPPAASPVPPPPALGLTGLTETPFVLAPAADGSGASAAATFALAAPARVRAYLVDAAGQIAANLLDEARLAGANEFSWSAAAVPDGRYRVLVAASAYGRRVRAAVEVVIDRTLTGLAPPLATVAPGAPAALSFTLGQSVPVRIDVLQGATLLGTLAEGTLPAGPQSFAWDGTIGGAELPAGTYTLSFTVTDALGDVTQTTTVTVGG